MKIMKDVKNTKAFKELAKINDEKAREEIYRIVIRDFSKAKREFVATYCGPDKELWLYKDSVTKLSTTFKKFAKALILTDCPWQNELFFHIANGYMEIEGMILYLMACSVIPPQAQSALDTDHSLEKMFFVAYGWQVVVCHLRYNELIVADQRYNWRICSTIVNDISKSILG